MWKFKYKAGYAIGAVYLLSAGAAFCLYGLDSGWIVALALHWLIFSFGVSFGLHKSIAHQMASPHHWLVRLAALVGALANTGSPVDYVMTHRPHHDHSDSSFDPQNSHDLGWRLLFAQRKVEGGEALGYLARYRTTLSDPFLLGIHKYYWLIFLSYCGLAFLIGGLHGFLFGALIPSGLSFFAVGALNLGCHSSFGYRNQEDNTARNVGWLFPLLLGECWHNNHHSQPGKSNYRKRFWELDPSAFYFIFINREKN